MVNSTQQWKVGDTGFYLGDRPIKVVEIDQHGRVVIESVPGGSRKYLNPNDSDLSREFKLVLNGFAQLGSLHAPVTILMKIVGAFCNEVISEMTESELKNNLLSYTDRTGINYVHTIMDHAWPETLYVFFGMRGLSGRQMEIVLTHATPERLDDYVAAIAQHLREEELDRLINTFKDGAPFETYLKNLPDNAIVGEAYGLPIVTGSATINVALSLSNLAYRDPVSVFLFHTLGLKVADFQLRKLELENGDWVSNPATALGFCERLNQLYDGPVTAAQCLHVIEQDRQEVWAFRREGDKQYHYPFYYKMREYADLLYKPINPDAAPLKPVYPSREEMIAEYKELMQTLAAGVAKLFFTQKKGRNISKSLEWLIEQGQATAANADEMEGINLLASRALLLGVILETTPHPGDYWQNTGFTGKLFFLETLKLLRSIFWPFTDDDTDLFMQIALNLYEALAEKKADQLAEMWLARKDRLDPHR